ncbi:N-acetylmuramoyl-L-alanine amidase [Bacillus manliponensis]|uniref:N-acetylmuramoyl-L-alanine amidase n=1 Tax=Bacillus manliponensis TaxID=574376 RepID=UPI00069103CF|nr:N-acetylmuramoyl-L-alanine amidase [Bacillus manliponensis]
MKIGLRYGHTILTNGNNTCAVGLVNEYTEVRRIGKHVKEMLESLGHTVIDCTPPDYTCRNQGEELAYGVNKANKAGVDLFISLHLNASNGEGDGVEVYYYSGDAEGKRLAQSVCDQIAKFGYDNRGARTKALYEINNTHMRAILVESFFIDNKADVARYNNDPRKIAAAIVTGVTGKAVSGGSSTPQQPSYRINIGDFDSIEWTAAALTKVKEILPGYGVWTKCIEGGYHRILVGDFNNKQWADNTMEKLKTLGYGAWIQTV